MDYVEGVIKNTEFFTTAELAKKLKMNVQVITRKVQAGEIEAFKIGKDWRIPESAVAAWLERNSNRNAGNKPNAKNGKAKARRNGDSLPQQPSKRKYLLEYILAQFEPNRAYSEAEVDKLIQRHHDDYETVRSEFLAEDMMEQIDDKYRRRAGYTLSR